MLLDLPILQKNCKYLDRNIFKLVWMVRTLFTKMERRGIHVRASSMKHPGWAQSHWQPPCYCPCLWTKESSVTHSESGSFTLPRLQKWWYDVPHAGWGGGGLPTKLLFLYGCMTEKPIALIFHCLCPFFIYVFYCSDHCWLVRNNRSCLF